MGIGWEWGGYGDKPRVDGVRMKKCHGDGAGIGMINTVSLFTVCVNRWQTAVAYSACSLKL